MNDEKKQNGYKKKYLKGMQLCKVCYFSNV